MHEYRIILKAAIEYAATIEADTALIAIDEAKQMLRREGQITDIEVEQAILIEDQELV